MYFRDTVFHFVSSCVNKQQNMIRCCNNPSGCAQHASYCLLDGISSSWQTLMSTQDPLHNGCLTRRPVCRGPGGMVMFFQTNWWGLAGGKHLLWILPRRQWSGAACAGVLGMRRAQAREGERLPYGTAARVSARRSLGARPEPSVQGSRSLITLGPGERVNCILCLSIKKSFFFFFFSFVLPHTLLHSLPHSHSLCLWLLFYPCLVWVSLGLDESNELLVFEEVLHCVANGYTSQSTGTFWKSLLLLLSNGYHELFSSPWLSTLSGLRKKMSKCMVKQLPSKNGEKCTVGLLLYTTLSKQISKS